MKTIILYESFFDNTKIVANAMGKAFPAGEEIRVLNVSEIEWQNVLNVDCLIVGSAHAVFIRVKKPKVF